MTSPTTPVRRVTRDEAIGDLRKAIESLQDDQHSICQIAAERSLFCHGFAQWSFGELRARYPQILRSRPVLTRPRLEELANRWQLARQWATDKPTACDVQQSERCFQQCRGWSEFSDADLEAFHVELCAEPVAIDPPTEARQ
jgi:hypothetical protein